MHLDPRARAVHGLTTLGVLVVLNVLHLAVCLGVVTIGPATAALLHATAEFDEDDPGAVLGGYLRALRRDFLTSLVVSAALLLPAVVLAFAGAFWLLQGGVLSILIAVLAAIGVLYLLAAFIWGCALTGRVDDPAGRTVRNALLLVAAEPIRTTVLLLVPLTALSLLLVFPAFALVLLSFGFTVGAYLLGRLLQGAFSRY